MWALSLSGLVRRHFYIEIAPRLALRNISLNCLISKLIFFKTRSIIMTSSNGNIFGFWPFVRGIHQPQRLVKLWRFLWSVPEQTVEQTIEIELRRNRAHYDVTEMLLDITQALSVTHVLYRSDAELIKMSFAKFQSFCSGLSAIILANETWFPV